MKRLLAAASACLLSSGAALAQVPVNFPPAGFEGRQYVDNKGCAYIRVGVGPTVDWVPRMTRTRQQVCGLQPTFPAPTRTTTAPAVPDPAPNTKVVAAPQEVAPIAEATVTETTSPTPKKTQVRTTAVVAAPVATPTRTTTEAPMATIATQAVPPVATPAPVRTTTVKRTATPVRTAKAPAPVAAPAPAATGPCTNRSALGAQYTNSTGVRCGPQTASPVTIISRGNANEPLPAVPEGYKRVWKDDRLNPYRGPRNGLAVPGTNVNVRVASAAPAAPAVNVTGAVPRYVQVATFGVPDNAQRTAQAFQRAGFPVRLFVTRSNQQIVMIGAVQGGTLEQSLASARKAGFSDAFIR